MGYSINRYPFTGSADFDVNFSNGYLARADVFVYVTGDNDVNGDPIQRTFDWLTDSRIRLTDVSGLTTADEVVIQRIVSKTTLASDFQNGSITRDSIDNALLKLLMIYQEILDNALGDKVDTVVLPTDVNDAVTFIRDNYTNLLDIATITSADLASVVSDVQTVIDTVAVVASDKADTEAARNATFTARDVAVMARDAARDARDQAQVYASALTRTSGGIIDRETIGKDINNADKILLHRALLPLGQYQLRAQVTGQFTNGFSNASTKLLMAAYAELDSGTGMHIDPLDTGVAATVNADQYKPQVGTAVFNFEVTDDTEYTNLYLYVFHQSGSTDTTFIYDGTFIYERVSSYVGRV